MKVKKVDETQYIVDISTIDEYDSPGEFLVDLIESLNKAKESEE